MKKAFEELKRKSASGEALAELRELVRYDLGSHKKTRLKIAGVDKSKTLLHSDIAEKHGERLAEELKKRAWKIGSEADKRLKFVTILQATVNPTLEAVDVAVKQLEGEYQRVFGDMKLWSRGATELEVVNLELLCRISRMSDNEARKLNVLEDLREIRELQGLLVAEERDKVKVLVHCHTVVDFGRSYEENMEDARKRIERYGYWKRARYQVKFDGLFKNRKTSNNLTKIAHYVTKGGNENLRYNAGFGRDLTEDLEGKIWREGLGRADKGGETIEDERGLSVAEVRALDELYRWLMDRRSDRRGYLITSSDR
jgi:hypothetical protein